ncbi:hypothetical protein [Acidovorax sp. M2(2025)]|uniref:hypothetical protein n=1 Tax=Acidovorax sp. M2(2025) TaxID=3411355 RepID=UPI003BF45F8A
MKKRFLLLSVLTFALALSGCATRTNMALQDDAAPLTEKSKPVFLLTATIKNVYRPTYQPQLRVVHVEKPGAKEAADHLNFIMDEKAKQETGSVESGNSYLLRLELEPGQYELRGLTSFAGSFPIHAAFFAPIHSSLEVSGNGVFYLGHIAATVRERQGNEFKAGPSIPLLDQAVAGASGGTFDVVITDQFEVDERAFRAKFPALAGVPIKKAILPAFDRAKAQQWWEAH